MTNFTNTNRSIRSEVRDTLITSVARNVFFGILAFIGSSILIQKFVSPYSIGTFPMIACIGLIGIDLYMSYGSGLEKAEDSTLQGLMFVYSVLYSFLAAPYIYRAASGTLLMAGLGTAALGGFAMWAARNMSITYNDMKVVSYTAIGMFVFSIINMFLGVPLIEIGICCAGMFISLAIIAFYINAADQNDYREQDVEKVSFVVSVQILSSLVHLFIYILRFMAATSGNSRRK